MRRLSLPLANGATARTCEQGVSAHVSAWGCAYARDWEALNAQLEARALGIIFHDAA